jgi:formylglycine-generating enzyme required for sulfatase activity
MGDNLPVEKVSWYDALVYCNKRSVKEGLTPVYSISGSTDPSKWAGVPTSSNPAWDSVICNWEANGYRLPTEAEWEYAARGGKQSKGYKYSGSNDLKQVGWYYSNAGNQTQNVGSKAANELGIHDMSGNVGEWCWDRYDGYPDASQTNPTGASSGSSRVLRGGSWHNLGYYCRVANRNFDDPVNSSISFGVRVARAIN